MNNPGFKGGFRRILFIYETLLRFRIGLQRKGRVTGGRLGFGSKTVGKVVLGLTGHVCALPLDYCLHVEMVEL